MDLEILLYFLGAVLAYGGGLAKIQHDYPKNEHNENIGCSVMLASMSWLGVTALVIIHIIDNEIPFGRGLKWK